VQQNPKEWLDVYSMRLLVTLLDEQSVTRTAERLGQPQPSISLALKRLRALFGDPLLVRDGNRMLVTDHAVSVREAFRQILLEVDAQVLGRTFDPSTEAPHFRMLVANCFGPGFLSEIVAQIRTSSPQATIEATSLSSFEAVEKVLADGGADIALGNWPHPPGHLKMSALFRSDIVCLVAASGCADHDVMLTMDQLLKESHVSLTAIENATLSPIDVNLWSAGFRRAISVSVSDYEAIPRLIHEQKLVFVTSRFFASAFATDSRLRIMELGTAIPAITFAMLWHERSHDELKQKWLRATVKRAVKAEHARRDIAAVFEATDADALRS
jgi:DNA-binding transcriptional LysR family regulator